MSLAALLALLSAPEGFAQQPASPTAPAPKGTLTKPPELLQFVEAPFPESELGNTGSVVLAITIRDDGTVEDAVVQESAGEAFDAAAVAGAKQFVFSPAEIDGKPARIRILYRYDFVEKVLAPTTGVFSGVVRAGDEHTPLPGVTVTLGDGQTATTDAEGRFEFSEVAPGLMTVTLEGTDLTALSTDETFTAGERLDAVYDVSIATAEEGEGDDLEIIVMAPTLQRQAVSTVVEAEEARKVPGTQGDVLRVVENLPGVARASLGTGALVVWGAAPEDTGVYVDGVPVPRLYHDGGLRSIVGSEFVRSVELVPGGYAAAYGRGLGGLVSVKTNRFDEAYHAAIAADLYDAAASISGPIGPRWNLGVAGRYGYVGPLLGAFYPGVEDFFPIPHYYDGQARVGVRLRPNETLDLTVLASSDATRRTAPNPDPARQAEEEKELRFQRVFLRYVRDLGDGSTLSATVFAGADTTRFVSSFGQVQTSIGTDVVLGGFRGSYRAAVAEALTLEGGLDAYVPQTEVVREGSIAVPSREGDVRAFGQPPPDQISSDAYKVVFFDFAPYVEGDVSLWKDRLQVVPGLRFDPYARSVSRAYPQVGVTPTNGLFLQDFRVEPRLAIRLAPTTTSALTFAWGTYGQQPQATDLSSSFGNPALPISTAKHVVVGGSLRPVEPLSIELTAFSTHSQGLAMRNPVPQPARAEALLASGFGRTLGVQALVRLDPTKGVYGWLSYTLSESERLDDAIGETWRPSDYDQRHVLTAVGGYELPMGLEIGLRVRLASGFPRTEAIGSFYDDRRDLYEPIFGEHNGVRLPTFFQADARIAQHFEIDGTKLDLSLDIQNVTDRENVEEFIYDADWSTRGAIRGLPILPVLGVRWSL